MLAAPRPPAQPAAVRAVPDKAASTERKKKGKGSPDAAASYGAGLLDEGGVFGGGEASMPPAMASWCAAQMTALTGNDDITLAEFLFSQQGDEEVQSYLSMYLGASTAVDAFAKEFTLRKRAARGAGESREWQTAGRKAKPPSSEDDGFQTAGRGGKKGKAKKADPSLLGFSVESSRIMQGEIDFVQGM